MARFELAHKDFRDIPFVYELLKAGVKNIADEESILMESEAFQWGAYPGVSSRVELFLKDAAVYVSLPIEEPTSAAIEDIKHFPAIYYVIKDVADGSERQRVVSVNCPFGWDRIDFLHCEDFKLLNTSSLAQLRDIKAKDAVLIRVYVEPPALASRVYSYEGILNWSLDNFSQRKLKGLEKLCGEESPYFYTGPSGYRVRVFVRPMRKVLRVFVYFCVGEFDDELTTSFPHCTIVTLLNRKNPEGNVVKRARGNIDNGAVYCIDMRITETVGDLIEDDTLFYSVAIRPTQSKNL